MKRSLCCLTCCLLAVTLIGVGAALGDPGAEDDAKKAEAAKKAETPEKAPEKKEPKDEEKDKQKDAKPPAAAEKPTPPKPATHTVEKGLLKIEASLDGVFEAQKATEIALRPEAWAAFKILKAVEHGTRVKRGDLLVATDLEKIDLAIGDLRREHEASDMALKLAEQAYQMLEKTTPMDLAAAERSFRELKRDTEHYFKVTRGMSIKSYDRYLDSAKFSLEYAQEELDQLEKMYKADDLTEETEEIILKRARRSVETAKFYLEREKIDHQEMLKVTIPRRDVTMKEGQKRSEFTLATARLSLPLALNKAKLDLDKLKLTRKRSDERLQKLETDRAAMTVKAPVAGVVYHGRFLKGKYSGGSSTSTGLREGSALTANQVFMTIVQPRPMSIRTTVAESKLRDVRAGVKGIAVPTGNSDLKLTAIVSRVSAVPSGAAGFDAEVSVALGDQAQALMPGMTCKLKLVSYLNKDALTVPPKAVETDELDERKQYVHLLDKDGKPKKQPVTLGRRTAEKVEVLKGLSPGDKILATAPKQKKSPAEPPKKTPAGTPPAKK